MKRKLDDVSKKLEVLYDRLRENSVSTSTFMITLESNNASLVFWSLQSLIHGMWIFQLSQTVILGLHQIVQAVQQYDYHTALQVYTQMVSQGNFSEISSFMPGLKMLIQSAMQMNVYVQTH